MKARCRSQSGGKVELRVLDLSPIGCMVERGVSRLVSVDLGAAEELLAAE